MKRDNHPPASEPCNDPVHEKFCQFRAQGITIGKSYYLAKQEYNKEIGDDTPINEQSCKVGGSRLNAKPHINKRLTYLINRSQSQYNVHKTAVKKGLLNFSEDGLYVSIFDYLEVQTNRKGEVISIKLRDPSGIPDDIKKFVETFEYNEKTGAFKIGLTNKTKLVELLGRMTGAFDEEVERDVTPEITLVPVGGNEAYKAGGIGHPYAENKNTG